MGIFFQAQDDYLDYFGDPTMIGKVGTDIEEGKCTWLLTDALARCDSSQRNVLASCVGQRDSASVEAVKEVYRAVGVEESFQAYEQECYRAMVKRIEDLPVPHGVLLSDLLAKVFKR